MLYRTRGFECIHLYAVCTRTPLPPAFFIIVVVIIVIIIIFYSRFFARNGGTRIRLGVVGDGFATVRQKKKKNLFPQETYGRYDNNNTSNVSIARKMNDFGQFDAITGALVTGACVCVGVRETHKNGRREQQLNGREIFGRIRAPQFHRHERSDRLRRTSGVRPRERRGPCVIRAFVPGASTGTKTTGRRDGQKKKKSPNWNDDSDTHECL